MANIIPGSLPNCPWRDATNRWTSRRHCVSVTCPSRYTERCCCCTSCRKRGRWRLEYLEGLDITVFPSQRPAIFWLSFQKIVEATLWAQTGLRKRAWNRSKGGKAQLLKEWHSPRAYYKLIKMTDKSNSTKPWVSICKLNDTHRGDRIVPRHYPIVWMILPLISIWNHPAFKN